MSNSHGIRLIKPLIIGIKNQLYSAELEARVDLNEMLVNLSFERDEKKKKTMSWEKNIQLMYLSTQCRKGKKKHFPERKLKINKLGFILQLLRIRR